MSPPTGRWSSELESPSATPMLDLARVLVRAASIIIGAYAVIFLAFAAGAGQSDQAVKYLLFLLAIGLANGMVELAIRRHRPDA